MIDRGPDDRQAERDIHGLAERQQLDRNQSLVVIAGDDGVELAAGGADEHSVGRKGPPHVNPGSPAGLHGRRQHRTVFRTDDAVLAGVRVEARQGESRRGDSEAREFVRRTANPDSSVSRVSRRGTSASGTWTVARTTRIASEKNIIATVGAAVRCARRSV
jgi:hypothetical protein